MKSVLTRAALATACLAFASQLLAAEPKRPECIAPAKPGGGFDLTCKLAQSGLKDEGLLKAPMRVTYMPGGVGAVAYNAVVAQRAKDPGTITAFARQDSALLSVLAEANALLIRPPDDPPRARGAAVEYLPLW